MKKIAITGANGFIGSFLVKELLKKKFSVTCLVRKKSNIELLPVNCDIARIDYEDKTQLKKLFKDHEILIHNAALTKAKNREEFKENNIDLTGSLVEIYNSLNSLKQFVFISSQAASGPSKKDHPKKETDECNPVSNYGKSKLAAEELIRTQSEKPWTIIRPAAVFGPGDKDFLIYFKLLKRHISLFAGNKNKQLGLIFVRDLIDLIISTLNNKHAFNQIFFASGLNVNLREFSKNLEKALRTSSLKITIPGLFLDIIAVFSEFISIFNKKPPLLNKDKIKELKQESWLVSNEKSKKMLGFEPSKNLLENLILTYDWYRENNWMK